MVPVPSTIELRAVGVPVGVQTVECDALLAAVQASAEAVEATEVGGPLPVAHGGQQYMTAPVQHPCVIPVTCNSCPRLRLLGLQQWRPQLGEGDRKTLDTLEEYLAEDNWVVGITTGELFKEVEAAAAAVAARVGSFGGGGG